MTMNNVDQSLIEAARSVATHAYARYSDFRVGAAVLTRTGNVYTGCNVENASFPVGTCAERNAIAAAVAEEGASVQFKQLVVVAFHRGQVRPCSPCGACRQAIWEFSPDAEVLFFGPSYQLQRVLAKDLLPN